MSLLPQSNLLIEHSFISSTLNKKVDSCLSPHGISFTEYTIMYHLHSAEGMAMSRIHLANNIGLTASGITRLLAPMEKIHIVVKESNPRDARQSLVRLSAAGEQLFQDASVAVEHTAQSAFSLFSKKELQLLSELNNKIK